MPNGDRQMSWAEYARSLPPKEFQEWISTGDTEMKKRLIGWKPKPVAPTPTTPVEQQAQVLVDSIKEQLARDQRERLAASMSGIINQANGKNDETPEQEERRRRETAERLERARHTLAHRLVNNG